MVNGRWRGVRADVACVGWLRLGLTWRHRNELARGARDVAWLRSRISDRRVEARPALDGGDFCAVEIIFERAFQWWWRCFDWSPEEGVPTKAVSLWRLFNLWRQQAHRNSDGRGRAIPEMVDAAEECQKRRRLHETLRAIALIPC